MRISLLISVLVACEPPPEESIDTGTPFVAPLAVPTVAVVSPTAADSFKSTCAMTLELVDSNGATVESVPVVGFKGGHWAAVSVGEGVQHKATIAWDDCENTEAGTGSFTSSTFSGEPGDLFAVHYDGVDADFEWMQQAEEFEGAAAHVQFVEGTTAEQVAEIAATLDVAAEIDAEDASFYNLSWTDDTSVAAVLTTLAGDEAFSWGEPKWIEKPAWW